MKKKIVSYEIDLENPPALTHCQHVELEALQAMSDESIDYSDIPPLTDDFWTNAISNPFYKPTKKSTTVRVDSDVLLWLKSKGQRYQTRINAILRAEMLRDIRESREAQSG